MLPHPPYEEKYYTSHDGLRLYYRDYNPENRDGPPLLCLHGLARNSRDFHDFARIFSPEHRVIALDMRGRGRSDYDPCYGNYQIPTYVQDVLTFLAQEKLDPVIAVGTSMGGLIAMMLGSVRPDVLRGIILNDIGPEIDREGLARISAYVGSAVELQNWRQARTSVKVMNGAFFPDYTTDDWEKFARNIFRECADGRIIADYDPNIGTAIRENEENAAPVDLWPIFESLHPIPLLTLRGENSDILSPDTLREMARRHPRFKAVTVPNRAHAPDLGEEISIREIRNFIGLCNSLPTRHPSEQ